MRATRIRRTVIAVALVALAFYLGYIIARSSAIRSRHLMVQLTRETSLIWEQLVPPIATGFPVADAKRVYMASSDTQRLLALDAMTGQPTWNVQLLNDYKGVRQLIADGSAVFSLTSTRVTAYDSATGEEVWSSRLGDGHVRVIAIDHGDTLAVLYGETFIRISKLTGQEIVHEPLGNLLWPSSVTQVDHWDGGMAGVDSASGKLLWTTTSEPFLVAEHIGPQEASASSLIALSHEGDICEFDLSVGTFNWCAPGDVVSNPGVSQPFQRVFVLASNFDLLVVDLHTGEYHAVASFQVTGGKNGEGSHEYAVSASQGRLFLYFGDTNQLFAFEILSNTEVNTSE